MRHLSFLFLSLLLLAFSSCTFHNSYSGVVFETVGEEPVLHYATSELKYFLKKTGFPRSIPYKQATFRIASDPSLPEGAFAIHTSLRAGKYFVNLTGHAPEDALDAVYTYLEKGGYLFDFTGPVAPGEFDWKAVRRYREKIVPAVRWRGIREHLNFPMDLSAWPVEQAKEYIRNLARMRFNAVTFHSYPGQWYEVRRRDTVEYAGHFFYGDVHTVPDYPAIRKIAINKRYFCIPEIEPYFENMPERSRLAVEWLEDVIAEAKHCGLKVRFSFEPRDASTDLRHSVETVKAILKEYPGIDELEFITEEAGGWGPRTTRTATEQVIREHFGEALLHDSIVMAPVREEQSDLAYIYGQIGHDVALIRYLREQKIVPDRLGLVLGIYVVIPEYARPAFYLARRYAPAGTQISLMPGHHSLRVQRNTAKVLRDSSDWQRAIIYSWIEFDGMMYVQQNGISGIRSIVQQATARTPGGQAHAILYNHWRMAENRITARYAAVSGVYGPVAEEQYYRDYAGRMGIRPAEAFAKAMALLDTADLTGMRNVGGFAFCWVGRWRNGGPVPAYAEEKLRRTRQAYESVLEELKKCNDQTTRPEGRDLLAFLDNRIRTTVIYIKAFEKGRELRRFDTKSPLSPEDKKAYVEICNESLGLFEQYIDLYAEENADRGCAGTLVSLWHSPMHGVRVYRERYGGVPLTDKVPPNTAIDAPPLPVIRKE